MSELATISISRSAMRHNFRHITTCAGGAVICAVVKANAYGHGLAVVVKACAGLKPLVFGVATPAEALELRKIRARTPILIFLPLDVYGVQSDLRDQIHVMLDLNARLTVATCAGLKLLAACAARSKKIARVHIKTDTGMGRNGCSPQEALELARLASELPWIRLEGIYSHFAMADAPDLSMANRQLRVFQNLQKSFKQHGMRVPVYHMANSGAVFNLPASHFDMVRPGLALYGYGGTAVCGAKKLRPVLRLEAPVTAIKWIEKGGTCGYDATFTARRKTRAGILPIGYADGYSIHWSNIGQVDFNGQPAPVIGRVSMDLTMVDLTDLPWVGLGTNACLISNNKKHSHAVEAMARRLNTIPYAITTCLAARIPRVLVD